MRFQLWTQHMCPPNQTIRLIATSGEIDSRQDQEAWVSDNADMNILEDYEQFLVCNDQSEQFINSDEDI